jgi:N-methylhydantoinase A
MLVSNVIKNYVKTVMLPGTVTHKILSDLYSPLIDQGMSEINDEGSPAIQIEILCSLDMRYIGQSFELNIPYSENFISDFHHAHNFTYGYSYSNKTIEIVNLRVKAIGKVPPIRLPRMKTKPKYKNPVPMEHKQVVLPEGSTSLPVYDYEILFPDTKLIGPLLIVSSDTTILVNKNDIITVDQYQNLLIEVCSENMINDNSKS